MCKTRSSVRTESSRSQWVIMHGNIYWVDISKSPADPDWNVEVVEVIKREVMFRDTAETEAQALSRAMMRLCWFNDPDELH